MEDGRLPDAYLAGAMKCGTTALHRLLAAHPEVYLPPRPQELHYFDVEENFARGTSWFAGFFAGHGDAPVVMQTSPLYVYHPAVPGRIRDLTPEARLIFILRDPADRAYSHYWHQVRRGREPLSFVAALDAEADRLASGPDGRRTYSYVDRGLYGRQLTRYLEHFRMEQLLVLRSEDLRGRPGPVLDQVSRFLGVDPRAFAPGSTAPSAAPAARPRLRSLDGLSRRLRRHWRGGAHAIDTVNRRAIPPLSDTLRRQLQEQFREDIEQTARLTGLDLSSWMALSTEVLAG